MKPESLALLKDLSRTLAATDGAIFEAECTDCSMPCDVECGKTCKVWYAIEAVDDCRYRLLAALGVLEDA